MSETGEEDNVMNRKKKRIQRAQSGQSGASGRRKKSDSSRPVPSGSGKVSPVLSNEADLDEQKITGSNTQASPAAQATPLVDELDGDGKPSPSAKPPIPKPAVEQKITNSMRKDFVRHRIDSTRSEVSNPMNDGYHLFTMMNMLSILGKDEEYVKSFVDRIMYLARPFENKNIDLNVLASKKVDGLGKMDASRVSDRMAEIAEMKSIMESEFETDWKNEENVDPSKLDEDRSEYRQYIIENITGAVISVGKFEDMAGIGHGLSFEVMSCASDVEIFRDTYRDRVDHESMNKLLESTRIYKEDSLILDESIKLAKARTEEVQRHNKDVVERNFEMAGSTLGVGAAAVAVAFPPALVVVLIAYLFYTNELYSNKTNGNKYMVNAVSAIKRGLKGQEDKFSRNLEKSTREGTAKVVSTASEERSKLIREFTESIPENMRPFVGSFMSRNLEDLKTVKKFTEARDREKEREKEGRGKEDKNEDERKNTKEDRRNRDRKSTSNEDKNNSEKKKEYEKLCECSSEVSEQLLDKEVSMHI